MYEALEIISKAALLFAAIFVMTAIGFTVARRYRDRKANDMSDTSDMMSKFRELHAEGGLSDEEFRTIKTKLADELKTELGSSPDNFSNSGDNSNTG
jgi:uncharacterized membrane protein